MAVSTIPAIKAALVTRFETDADLSGIQINWGNPYPARMQDELIIVGKATKDEEPAGLGNDGSQESYTLEVAVSVVGSARVSQQTLETRAWAIVGVIEDSIKDWRSEATPYNGISGWIHVAGAESGEGITDDGNQREASVMVRLAVVARI